MVNRRLLKSLVILVQIFTSVFVYYSFFDILITDGSFRASLGQWFLIPMVVLVLTQVFVTGSLIHLAMLHINSKTKANRYDAFTISGLNTSLFSLTYVIFPLTGPFHYITFAMGTSQLSALLIEILWTTFTIFVVGTALKRTYSVSWFYGLLLGGMSSLLILAFAS